MRKLQYEKMKSREIVPPAQIESNPNTIKADIANPQYIARSIDKTIKEFNDKYGSVLLDNIQRLELQTKENRDSNLSTEMTTTPNEPIKSKENIAEDFETQMRRLSVIDNHLESNDDLPSLVPLELPSFDYTVFGVTSGLVENFQK